MTALLSSFGLLVGLLHLVGGFVAGLWLLFTGQWWALGMGFLALVVARFAIGFALVPGLFAFGTPAAALETAGRRKLARVFHALTGANTVIVMTAWCFLIAWYFLSRAEGAQRLPLLVWSYAIALGPWIGFAARDTAKDVLEGVTPGAVSAQTVTFFIQLAYITAGVCWFFGWVEFRYAFLPLMTVALMLMAELSMRRASPEVRRRVSSVRPPGETTLDGEGRVSSDDGSGHGS